MTASSIIHLMNLYLNTGLFSNEQKIAKVIPICNHLSGAQDNPENYLPISVWPIISRILERAMYQQLRNHMKDNSLRSQFQFSFRKNWSTQLSLTYLMDNVTDEGNLTGAVFIDLKKAFDRDSL